MVSSPESEKLPSSDEFPDLKRLFTRKNTVLPSSAPVEHLFRAGAWLIFETERALLSDVHFVQLVLLNITDRPIL
jgi:hypothetical protein